MSSSHEITRYNRQSSANNLKLEDKPFAISLIYTRNKSGPKTATLCVLCVNQDLTKNVSYSECHKMTV